MTDYSNTQGSAQWWAKYGLTAVKGQANAEESTRTSRSPNGGWAPVFLQGHDWAMRSITHSRTSVDELIAAEEGAALVVLKDDGARVWYVPGLETPEQFFTHFGLEVSMSKGVGPLMKRLARILVDFRSAAWLERSAVRVRFLRHGAVRSKAYDGSAMFSREFVKRLARERIGIEYTPYIRACQWALRGCGLDGREAPAELKRQLAQEILRLQRLAAHTWAEALRLKEGEFAWIDQAGLEKGQAKVTDATDYDVQFPTGSVKSELRLTGTRVFVGIKSITAHDHVFLDRQSMTNLNTPSSPGELGFFSYDPDQPGDRLVRWMAEKLAAHKAAVDDGRYNDTLNHQIGRLAWEADVDKFLGFFINRFAAMGGDVRWFRRTLLAAYQAGLKPIENRLAGTAYPTPGLRLYVRPASMGNRHVKRGQVAWDLAEGVVYVNDVDAVTLDERFHSVHHLEMWLARGHTLAELCPGLQPKLGGYDNDDAFLLHPFIDWDGTKRVLVSRQPNMPGEFHILEFVSGDVPEGQGFWFKADSRRLKVYKHPAIDPEGEYAIRPYGGAKVVAYSWPAINHVARLLVRSRSAVGMFCLMIREIVLTEGDLPDDLPAYTEAVIDASVKTLDDVSGIIRWANATAMRLVAQGKPVPQLIYDELIRFLPESWIEAGKLPVQCPPHTHWVDVQTDGALKVISDFKTLIGHDSNLATPPAELFERAAGWAEPGLKFKGVYGQYLWAANHPSEADEVSEEDDPDYFAQVQQAMDLELDTAFEAQSEDERYQAVFEEARRVSQDWLSAHFPLSQWPMVLVGGLAATYTQALATRDTDGLLDAELKRIGDSAFFQLGRKLQVGREPGLDSLLLEGLVAIGVLRDLTFNKHVLRMDMRTLTPLIGVNVLNIRHGWYNFGLALGQIKPSQRMAGLDGTLTTSLKERFAKLNLVGVHFTAESRMIQVGPRKQERVVLVSTGTKNMLGILNGVADPAKLPKVMRVVQATTVNDDTWLMLASD